MLAPYGLAGGRAGSRGSNLLSTAAGRTLSLGGKCSVRVEAGDVFRLQTPGGGGWGREGEGEGEVRKKRKVEMLERGSVWEYKQQQHSA